MLPMKMASGERSCDIGVRQKLRFVTMTFAFGTTLALVMSHSAFPAIPN